MDRVDAATLARLVKEYQRSKHPRLVQKERKYFQNLRPLLEVAIQNAVMLSPIDGRKHHHQWKIRNDDLEALKEILLRSRNQLRIARDFDEIYDIVNELKCSGIGSLTVYDVSLRIGWYLGKEPMSVYLHLGTAEGAGRLGYSGNTISKSKLPEALSPLTCAEIEDFLCIYKNRFEAAETAG